jgi:hypothetical protein
MSVYTQKLEGLVIFGSALLTFDVVSGAWLAFILLLLVPDVSMVGYLLNKKVGAVIYNTGHSLVLPLLFLTFGFLYQQQLAVVAGLIWLAHIGIDRMLGYGLKEASGFKHTHLGRIGK